MDSLWFLMGNTIERIGRIGGDEDLEAYRQGDQEDRNVAPQSNTSNLIGPANGSNEMGSRVSRNDERILSQTEEEKEEEHTSLKTLYMHHYCQFLFD